jgi:hypothetical protein
MAAPTTQRHVAPAVDDPFERPVAALSIPPSFSLGPPLAVDVIRSFPVLAHAVLSTLCVTAPDHVDAEDA